MSADTLGALIDALAEDDQRTAAGLLDVIADEAVAPQPGDEGLGTDDPEAAARVRTLLSAHVRGKMGGTVSESRQEGERWQGPSGHWFTIKDGRAVPAAAPDGSSGSARKAAREQAKAASQKRKAALGDARKGVVEHAKTAEAIEDALVDSYWSHPSVDRLRDALFDAYQPTFRGSSKLIGPHPKQTSNHKDDLKAVLKAADRALARYASPEPFADPDEQRDRGKVQQLIRKAALFAQRGLQKIEAVKAAKTGGGVSESLHEERQEGETWQGQSGRWFTLKNGHTVPHAGPGQSGGPAAGGASAGPKAPEAPFAYPEGYKPPSPNSAPSDKLPRAAQPNLDAPEASALTWYADDGYRALNAALYQGADLTWSAKGIEGTAIALLKGKGFGNRPKVMHQRLQQAFAKAPPLPAPVPVFRGLSFPNEKAKAAYVKQFEDAQAQGGGVSLPGYQSTTVGGGTAGNFADSPVTLEIDAVHGLDVGPYSLYHHESELLLDHDSTFTVKGIERDHLGRVTIKLAQQLPTKKTTESIMSDEPEDDLPEDGKDTPKRTPEEAFRERVYGESPPPDSVKVLTAEEVAVRSRPHPKQQE